MMRIVQLTTYPLKSPRHGGQLRCAAIRDGYRRIGIDVETIAVMHEAQYRAGEREKNDIALPGASAFWNLEQPRFVDLQTGACLAGEDRAYQAFKHILDRAQVDAIQLEQPWLYPAAKRYVDERKARGEATPRIIYSSQNIEWKLKRDERGAHDAPNASHMIEVRKVEALELDVAMASDLIVACTDEEAQELKSMRNGSTDTPCAFVTASNAIAPFEADSARLASLKQRHGLDRYPIFVGSAHPPNADGFWRMLEPSLAFLRPDEKIVVAGGVGHILRDHPICRAWSGINEPRLLTLGEIDRADLSALLHGAAVILLPITTGGGSNLKTAEAIYTGNPVLATKHALRGYGDAAQWPTITIAETADAFRRRLRALLDNPALAVRGDAYRKIRERVTWDHALAPLIDAIRDFAQQHSVRATSGP